MKLNTVTIKTDAGPVVINESDFDKSKHKLHESKPKKEPKPNKAPAAKKA